MNVLGLSFDYHDAAAALLCDGVVVSAIQEERLSKIKHDASFPRNAIDYCLQSGNLISADLDHVVFYENPLKKFDRIYGDLRRRGPGETEQFWSILEQWLRGRRFEVKNRIAESLDLPVEKIHLIDHHQSHAASAFFCSPVERAAVLTVDGVGEWETCTLSRGDGNRLDKISAVDYPHSLGLFYSAITSYLGFEVNEGEYKVMGMSSYGEPEYFDQLMAVFEFAEPFGFTMDHTYFDFHAFGGPLYSTAMADTFGPARIPGSPFDPISEDEKVKSVTTRYANLAASAQKCTEEIMLKLADQALKETGERALCLAGGVALNSVANGRIQRELDCDLYVQPAAGDAGGALGAALYYHHCVLNGEAQGGLSHAYLGSTIDAAEIEQASAARDLQGEGPFPDQAKLIELTAQKIADGEVVGWCQGRSEWGPRALGNRSILANPAIPDMNATVNKKIKFREPFRPFAASVLAERAPEFFDVDGQSELSPERFMLSVCPVLEAKREIIPSITHVDGSCRVHLVFREVNPLFYDLIARLGEITGIPLVLNTSLNLNGMPIADSAADAMETFLWCKMDALVVGDWIFDKS